VVEGFLQTKFFRHFQKFIFTSQVNFLSNWAFTITRVLGYCRPLGDGLDTPVQPS
jgi:hypothetical protein